MSKQVREAAELVIRGTFTLTGHHKVMEAVDEVCRAWLAEHPADDDEIADIGWIRMLPKVYWDDVNKKFRVDSGNQQEMFLMFVPCEQGRIEIYIETDEFHASYLCDVRTRGDVRRLARALRVELGEER